MFEIGFLEVLLVAVVALLVVGPQRLPKLAYEVGLWVGRMQRYLRDARFQIENELHNYEIKNSLQQPKQMLEDIKSEIDDATRDPWVSPHFTGEAPSQNPAGVPADPAVKNAADEAATNSAAVKTESTTGNGQSKPRT